MRRHFSLGLSVLLAFSLILVGCGKSSGEDAAKETTEETNAATAPGTSITLLNIKTEVNDQINELAAKYEAETGVHVEVMSTGPSVDGQAMLKGYYLSDQMPDIIACEASGFSNWQGLLVDMSEEEWASRTSAAYVDDTYGTIGFPYTTEAIGLAYNAEILSKCGVDPKSIRSLDSMRAAFEAVDAKKDELGLTAVMDCCVEPEGLGWSPGNHLFGVYIDSGLSRDDTTYIDGISTNHAVDSSRFSHFTEMISLFYQYTDTSKLLTANYDEQVGDFAAGKYAFITQGSWIGASLLSSDAYSGFEVGMAPYAFEDGFDTILTSAPSWWAIPKEGNVEASKAFLQWCSESAGQQILVEKAGFVSPFTDCTYVASDPFAGVLASYVADGKTSDWHWMQLPSGIGNGAGGLCYCFYRYANGETDAGGFMEDINRTLATWYAKM